MLYLALLLATLRRALHARRDLLIENLALRQQLAVYTRRGRRPQLRNADRRFWSLLARSWAEWRSTLVLVQPDSVVRWHRGAWRLLDVEESQPGTGPPANRCETTRAHSAHRPREPALGRGADRRRAASTRARGQRGDGAPLSAAGSAAATLAKLARLPTQSPPRDLDSGLLHGTDPVIEHALRLPPHLPRSAAH